MSPRLRTGLVALGAVLQLGSSPATGTLRLVVLDADSGLRTPARVELIDDAGRAHVPKQALRVAGDCRGNILPEWVSQVQVAAVPEEGIFNPYTGTAQFYVDGIVETALAPGSYRLRVFKGIEYTVASRNFEIAADESREVQVEVTRWIDPRKRGWYSADGHLHIARLSPEADRGIAAWMRAEDLHVANLLELDSNREAYAVQYGFGDDGLHRDGSTLLAAGQEIPRTRVFGHGIILGARSRIRLPDDRFVYLKYWREAARHRGLSGYAHWGIKGARDGLALDAASGLVSFLEVLGFDRPDYEVLYELLDLGFRVTPTAGTDHPCGPPTLPGRERFYTRVAGELSYESWLEGVRRGRTFVTNGPLLELSVAEVGGGATAGIGDELRLDGPARLSIEGSVRFDPARDDVQQLTLIRNGRVQTSTQKRIDPGEIRFLASWNARESSWLAVRASGKKIGEVPLIRLRRRSAAHSAAIYITVAGTPPLAQRPRAKAVAREWLERVDRLEDRLLRSGIPEIETWSERYGADGDQALQRVRTELLDVTRSAREHYREQAR